MGRVSTLGWKLVIALGVLMSLAPAGVRIWAEHQRRVRMEAWDADIRRIKRIPAPRSVGQRRNADIECGSRDADLPVCNLYQFF
jgi:hypothetical protein